MDSPTPSITIRINRHAHLHTYLFTRHMPETVKCVIVDAGYTEYFYMQDTLTVVAIYERCTKSLFCYLLQNATFR